MHAVIKFTKISPCLMASLLGLRAMVHRNTKEYMLASNMDCIAPSSAMAGSAGVLWEGGSGEGAAP
jgi:hypothetical protein